MLVLFSHFGYNEINTHTLQVDFVQTLDVPSLYQNAVVYLQGAWLDPVITVTCPCSPRTLCHVKSIRYHHHHQ